MRRGLQGKTAPRAREADREVAGEKKVTAQGTNSAGRLLLLDVGCATGAIALLGFLRISWITIPVVAALPLYLLLTERRRLLPALGIAALYAALWVAVANGQYGHNNGIPTLFGFNLFPFFWWSGGLFGIYALLDHSRALAQRRFLLRWLLFSLLFWTLLITFETLAYHVWNIRNVATGMYPGLPLCDCIHAPRWMQACYLLNGPLYYLVMEFFGKRRGDKKRPRRLPDQETDQEGCINPPRRIKKEP